MVYINKSYVDVIVCKYSFFNSAYISCQSSWTGLKPSTAAHSSAQESEAKIKSVLASEALCYGSARVSCSDFEQGLEGCTGVYQEKGRIK